MEFGRLSIQEVLKAGLARFMSEAPGIEFGWSQSPEVLQVDPAST